MCVGQSDPEAIWVWDSMNAGSDPGCQMGQCGQVGFRGAVWREAKRLSLAPGKEPPTIPTVSRKLNST